MALQIDHIFIFSKEAGTEADELVRFGLTEGSSRRHPGQGTQNRKFYFENFFLEVLFVVDEEELSRPKIQPTGLAARAHFQQTGYSPFGLCLVNNPETDPIFDTVHIYQPDYFPEGMGIDVKSNDNHPSLPWMFRLPFRGGSKKPDEPTDHPIGIRRLTKAQWGVNDHDVPHSTYFDGSPIQFIPAPEPHLTLVFDDQRQGQEKHFSSLPVSILY